MKAIIILSLLLMSQVTSASEEESEFLKGMRLGCEKQKVALGCYNYANLLLNRDKADEAKKYFKLGCDGGHEKACSQEPWESIAKVETKMEEAVAIEREVATTSPMVIEAQAAPTPSVTGESEIAQIPMATEVITPIEEADQAPTELALAPEEQIKTAEETPEETTSQGADPLIDQPVDANIDSIGEPNMQ